MERRQFVERLLTLLAMGGLLVFGGCSKGEKPEKLVGFGNQEKLWQLAEGQGGSDEPVELSYSKNTPALYRDASMGKADPSFVPKVAGG
jgi:hypothetical protein